MSAGNGYRLCDHCGMSDIIPFILTEEKERLKMTFKVRRFVTFDGINQLGEALVIVLRFVDSFVIKQYRVCFQTLAELMAGKEIARELISVLSVDYGITPQ